MSQTTALIIGGSIILVVIVLIGIVIFSARLIDLCDRFVHKRNVNKPVAEPKKSALPNKEKPSCLIDVSHLRLLGIDKLKRPELKTKFEPEIDFIRQGDEELVILQHKTCVDYRYYWKDQELAMLMVEPKQFKNFCRLDVHVKGKPSIGFFINRNYEVDVIVVEDRIHNKKEMGYIGLFDEAENIWREWKKVFEDAGVVGLDEPLEDLSDYYPPKRDK